MEKRLYGIFEKVNGQWVRIHEPLAFKKSVAIRVFQNALLAPYLGYNDSVRGIRELKVIKP
jgi:hypothetical protein